MDNSLTRDMKSWRPLFEVISEGRRAQLLTIEMLDEELGDQLEADRMPFESIDFDPRSDVIVVAVAGREPNAGVVLRHLIHGPQTVELLDRPDASLVMRVVDGDGVETLLTFAP